MIETGTRRRQCILSNRPPASSQTKTLTRDVGLATNVTASITFNAGTGQATAAASTFAGFSAGQVLLVEGSNTNNGYFKVSATDASTYLTLFPPPKNEGPLIASIRTS
jgi:hypothetical protein